MHLYQYNLHFLKSMKGRGGVTGWENSNINRLGNPNIPVFNPLITNQKVILKGGLLADLLLPTYSHICHGFFLFLTGMKS